MANPCFTLRSFKPQRSILASGSILSRRRKLSASSN
jgi:hypothetical protein